MRFISSILSLLSVVNALNSPLQVPIENSLEGPSYCNSKKIYIVKKNNYYLYLVFLKQHFILFIYFFVTQEQNYLVIGMAKTLMLVVHQNMVQLYLLYNGYQVMDQVTNLLFMDYGQILGKIKNENYIYMCGNKVIMIMAMIMIIILILRRKRKRGV